MRRQSNIDEVIGFTFPRHDVPTFVTKVIVRWEALSFHYKFIVLKREDVQKEVAEAIDANDSKFRSSLQDTFHELVYFPLRLTAEELSDIVVSDDSVVQVESNGALILASKNWYFKSSIIFPEADFSEWKADLWGGLYGSVASVKLVNLPTCIPVKFFNRWFEWYTRLQKPMTPTEAKCCLTDLLKGTAAAIRELHMLG